MVPTIPWPREPQDASDSGKIVGCGAFVSWKKNHVIVEAFNQLPRNRNTQLFLYGLSSTPLEADYQQQIVQQARQNPLIHLVSWDPCWLDKLQPQDIFVHAAEAEPFGIVILEAFAKGCRLVVPHGTFLDDLPEPYRSRGIFRADNSAQDFAAKLALAQKQASLENLWGLRKEIASEFNLEISLERLSALYRSVLPK